MKNMKNRKRWFWLGTLLFCSLPGFGMKDFVWQTGKSMVIACDASEEPVVQVALDLFRRDCRSVLSQEPVVGNDTGGIYVGTIGKSKLIEELIGQHELDTTGLGAHKEAFLLTVLNDGRLVVAGSDKRGTAYGILQVSRMLGVSPWEWWADAVPQKRDSFCVKAGYRLLDYPDVPYRGIFINDEDWGINPWSWKQYEPTDVKGQMGPRTHERIFELLLRLRANTFWPAMHECSVPFFFTEGNKEVADRYGIYLGTSHCEPMMRNTNGEWKVAGKGEYDYLNNRRHVLDFWEERVRQQRRSDNIYTLGMRGVHDGKMQGAKTVEEQKDALTRIIADQRKMLSDHVNRDVTQVPQVLIPYKEVLDVYRAGLEVPEDVTLMWCDDNYGYVTHFPTEEERGREGGNGIYYHVSYWGRPHDYLWLATPSPYLVYQQMKLAYDKGIRKMWILNVGDIKPAEYQIELFMDMAWNIGRVEETGVTGHLNRFLSREFGVQAASYLLPMMQEHYRLAYIRKPEFMGNTRTEEKDPKYKIVSDLPWSENLIRERLAAYGKLEDEAAMWALRMPADKRAAYFQLVQYPLQGAAEMNKKCLYAQLARHGLAEWEMSDNAFERIVAMTEVYNQGKWEGFMDYKPRNLAVYLPVPHVQATDSLVEDRSCLHKWNGLEAAEGNPVICEGLGYEGKAAGIGKGKSVAFCFSGNPSDSVEIELCLLPNHPIDNRELRIQVMLDGKATEPISYRTFGRSEEWKLNVLTNRARRIVRLPLASGEEHRLEIKALDEGVILDQVYVYPVGE